MKKLMLGVMVLVCVSAGPASAEISATCGMATLVDVDVVSEIVPQLAITTIRDRRLKPGEREGFAFTTPAARVSRKYIVTVRLDDRLYTGESAGNAFWDFNPTRLVINDEIHACVDKKSLRLARPDGKDYKTSIVRVVRDPGVPRDVHDNDGSR